VRAVPTGRVPATRAERADPAAASAAGLPRPPGNGPLGHLWRWATDPVRLLADGARTGEVFRLRLWRPVVVGYRPEWNQAVLRDLDTFRSRGSLSGLTPYLAGGVVHTDVPGHGPRRRELNQVFHARALRPLTDRLRAVAEERLPADPFEGLSYASGLVRRMLNAAFFAGRMPDPLLARFLAPLHRPPPAPLLPRPALFGAMDAAVTRLLRDPPPGTLCEALAGTAGAAEEIRVALAAGYDTTAHTLAWALWWLAERPRWRTAEALPMVMDELLRLYPAGWLGSRVSSRDVTVAGVDLPAGTMVLYSPYLTHRDPDLWPEPDAFRPDRFRPGHDERPAWGYLPFGAGRRTCLGAHLARAMLRCALEPFCEGTLVALDGDPTPMAGITLRPRGPLRLSRTG
jgi:cytochrome P450